jgi:hypothetical protein
MVVEKVRIWRRVAAAACPHHLHLLFAADKAAGHLSPAVLNSDRPHRLGDWTASFVVVVIVGDVRAPNDCERLAAKKAPCAGSLRVETGSARRVPRPQPRDCVRVRRFFAKTVFADQHDTTGLGRCAQHLTFPRNRSKRNPSLLSIASILRAHACHLAA